MRSVSLVRAWLYGVRGFVVMTISLAFAFGVAISGPPTNSEIELVSRAVSRAAAEFGRELEAAAIDTCPKLAPDIQPVCGLSPQEPPQQPPPPPDPEAPPRAERAFAAAQSEPARVEARVAESELLGGPAPRLRAERPSRRATTQQASQRRLARPRAESSRRAADPRRLPARREAGRRTAPRAAATQPPPEDPNAAARIRAAQAAVQGDLSRGLITSPRAETAPPVEPAPADARPGPTRDGGEPIQAERGRPASEYSDQEEHRYLSDEERYYEEREARRRYWREERRRRNEREEERRRRYEREFEPAPNEDYYEQDAYPEEEPHPDEIW
jgi:hypothetical protein